MIEISGFFQIYQYAVVMTFEKILAPTRILVVRIYVNLIKTQHVIQVLSSFSERFSRIKHNLILHWKVADV